MEFLTILDLSIEIFAQLIVALFLLLALVSVSVELYYKYKKPEKYKEYRALTKEYRTIELEHKRTVKQMKFDYKLEVKKLKYKE